MNIVRYKYPIISICLFVIGLINAYISTQMPIFRDEAAYNKAYESIITDLQNDVINIDEAGRRFHDNVATYNSGKTIVESASVAMVTLSLCIIVYYRWNLYVDRKRKLPPVSWMYSIAIVTVIAYLVLASFFIITEVSRGLYPYWADSLGIPLLSMMISSPIILSVVIGYVALITKQYTQKPQSASFGPLPLFYKTHFIMSSFVITILLLGFIQYPDFSIPPLIAGIILFNYFLFISVPRKQQKHTLH